MKYSALVLDAGAFFKATSIHNVADEFYTIPEVWQEVKTATIPLLIEDIKTKSPSAEAYAHVVEFAKKTGDFAVLSATDLKVIALTYQLENEKNSGKYLRHEPVGETTQVGSSSDSGTKGKTLPDGWYSPPATPVSEDDLTEAVENLELEESESDDDGWITPKNVKNVKANSYSTVSAEEKKDVSDRVACMSGDFALQNVVIQMGMLLMSPDGTQIKYLKNWVLRCHACYAITKQMEKKFCPMCGGANLIRTSFSVDPETGKVTYYLKKNFKYRLRGTKYSIPTPKGGRNNDIVLREDQKEFQRGLQYERRQKKRESKMWEDMGLFELTTKPVGKSNEHYQGSTTIGFGRKNPNAAGHKRK